MYARQPTAEEIIKSGWLPEDFETEPVEVFPENWQAFSLFCKLQSQWNVGMSGATGLQYLVLFALMDRLKLSDDDHDALFDDIQTLERAALEAMSAKD
ncbi:MAG: DUF1799 domain-containing protein [Polaromonas sp.]